jgi:hypothetical protein
MISLQSLKPGTTNSNLHKFSLFCVTLALADFTISAQALAKLSRVSLLVGKIMNGETEDLTEIDEALIHASRTRNDPAFTHRQKAIVNKFIDDLLDSRSELTKC